MRALFSVIMLLALSFSAQASGGYPHGSLVFKGLGTQAVNKGKIDRVILSHGENGAVINVFSARANCMISVADAGAAAIIFQTINSDSNKSIICTLATGDINGKEAATSDFSVENDRQ